MFSPRRPCRYPGCPNLVESGYCARHRRATPARERESAAARGYDLRWQKARIAFLSLHPLCAVCGGKGLVTKAEVVDHIVPHRGDTTLFWDQRNWQALCPSCHSAKTAREDGGFGNG